MYDACIDGAFVMVMVVLLEVWYNEGVGNVINKNESFDGVVVFCELTLSC